MRASQRRREPPKTDVSLCEKDEKFVRKFRSVMVSVFSCVSEIRTQTRGQILFVRVTLASWNCTSSLADCVSRFFNVGDQYLHWVASSLYDSVLLTYVCRCMVLSSTSCFHICENCTSCNSLSIN